jgi:glycosyltransferase involved in cell wall biosynthesis
MTGGVSVMYAGPRIPPMRILVVTRTYRLTGGADRYALALQAELERRGHAVIPFAAHHPQNLPTPWARYFPPDLGFSDYGPRDRLRALARAMTGGPALRALRRLLAEHPVDLVHAHTTFHQVLPPVAFAWLRRRGVPVVMTAHDYKLVCPTYWQYVADEDAICRRCAGRRFYHAALRGCAGRGPGGALKGALVALEAYLARWTGAYAGVAQFICPSAAMRENLARYGMGEARLYLLPYFVPAELLARSPEEGPDCQAGPLFLFVGRLVAEKGGLWLARAAADLGLPIAFLGDGPQRAAIEALAAADPNLRCVGWADAPAVAAWMRRATALIVPSLWPDNSPMVIYEAAALGLPVVGARVGGIPELVREGETGLLFERGDAAGLRAALRRLAGDPALRARLGAGARARAQTEWTPDRHVAQLLEVYARAIGAGRQ